MVKDKENGGKVIIVPTKDSGADVPLRGGFDYIDKKSPEPVRDTLPPPPPQKPEKK